MAGERAPITILSPEAPARVTERPLAVRPPSLGGLTIGLLDNLKANAGPLLAEVGRHLTAHHPGSSIVTERKIATAASPPEVMARLRTYDAVVLAIAD